MRADRCRRVFRRLQPAGLLSGALLLFCGGICNGVRAAPGTVLFYDDFNGNLNAFTVVASGGDASLGNETARQGQSLRLRWGAVSIYTDPIAAAVPGAELSVWIRRGDDSFSEDPDNNEDLVIEFRDTGGNWIPLDSFPGNGTPGEIITPVYTLPPAALHANLSIRFRLTGGNGPDNDYWHLDDPTVTETGNGPASGFGLGQCEDFESGLGGWTINGPPGRVGTSSATASSPTSSLYTRLGRVDVSSPVVDLSSAGSVDFSIWIRRGAEPWSKKPEDDEDLIVEYLRADGSWGTLEFFDGAGTEGQIYVRTYALPADALHAAFQVRFRHLGNGEGYWHYDDACLSAAAPVILYSFEETSWTGAAGEIVDTNGVGPAGTAFGGGSNDDTAPALPSNPGTCRYGEFDGNNDYVEFPDGPALDMSGPFTSAAWIYMRSFPSELHTIVSKDWNYEYHIDSAGRVYWWWNDATGTTRSITTGASINLDQWYHVAVVYESGRQTIYVNGAPWATASYSGTLRQNDLPMYVGTDWNFISRAFDGYIDEVAVIPAAYTQAEVQALRDATHPCATAAAQFTINHDNYGIHCLPETITVDVIDSVAGTPLPSYNAQVELDTGSGYGSWTLVSGSGAFNDAAAGDGLATYDWPLGETQAVFALSYPQGPPVIDVDVTQVSDPGIRDTDAEGPLLFAANGFTLSAAPLANPLPGPPTVPVVPYQTNRVAAETFPIYIAAYGVTDNDPVCGVIESYTGNQNLKFWSNYLNPGSGTRQVAIDGVPAATSEAGAVDQLVSFTNGQGVIQAKYKDVGQIEILVKDDSLAHPDLPAGIRGGTAAFVSVPADFELSAIENAAGTVANPAAGSASGPVFLAAGRPFQVTVTALDLEGDPTPNYGQENIPETVRLDVGLVAPAGGSAPGLVAGGGFAAFSGGSATGADFAWPEVGIIELTPGVGGDADYLGAGDVVGTPSGNIGRFVPDHFELALNTPQFGTVCVPGGGTPFTYMGERFDYAVQPVVTVSAKAYGGSPPRTTQNYTGAFFKLSVATLANWAYTTAAGTLLGPPTIDAVVADLTGGIGTISFDGGISGFSYDRELIAPFGADIDLTVDVVDADGVNALGAPTPLFADIAFDNGDADEIRYGRLRFRNAIGSERIDLPVPLVAEYFAGSGVGFVQNGDDECSTNTTLAFTGYTENLNAGETCVRDAGAPGVSGEGCAAPAPAGQQFNAPPTAGNFNLILAAPGLTNTGSVTIDSIVPSWLRFDWNAAVPGDENPSGQATFGLFSGDNAQIYLREVY